VECGSCAPLKAMIGPEDLGAVINLNGLEGLGAGMGGRKRDMPRRMPVLSKGDVAKTLLQAIDQRNDLIAVLNRKRAAGAEVILQIDDDEGVSGLRRHGVYFLPIEKVQHPSSNHCLVWDRLNLKIAMMKLVRWLVVATVGCGVAAHAR